MSEQKQAIYPKGLYFNKIEKRETQTDEQFADLKKWKKGGLAVHRESFIAHMNEQEVDDKGYLKYDLIENTKKDDGTKFLSFKLNTWKKEDSIKDINNDMNPADSPF